ncbi:SDR family oxidoreductase [Candidatus Pelagibacter bacterium nBUS_44]|uniref:SDR family oxidoreductase n=1 Tax=Candidatus Pelagibacter bacterium nBUS_44 TaxID=3374195 RepID=UPI003EC040BA
MSKVCIVGSSGYLGSKILLSLKKKFKIISVSRKKIYQKNFNEGLFKSIIGDIRSKKTINKIVSQKPEYIIFASGFNHFRSEKNFKKTINNNNDSLLSLCENISKNENFKKIIYLSSFQVYGNYQENELINEKTPKNPKNFYGLSHSINEDILNIAKNKFKINFEIIRLTNAYGYPSLITNDCWWLVINDLCKNYVFKKKIVINSDGNPFRNFIHLNDVAEFIKLLLYKKKKPPRFII